METSTKLRLLKLELKNFSSYQEAIVRFPKTGIVLLEGKNGAGKSSILEAFVEAGWGRPLRAGPREWVPLRQNGFISAILEKNGANMEIKRLGSFKTSPSNPILGPLSIFTNGNVFSRHTLDKFTVASNTERRRLIEDILGINTLEKAAIISRKNLSELENNLTSYRIELQGFLTRIEDRKLEIARLEKQKTNNISDMTPLVKEREKLIIKEAGLEAQCRALSQRLSLARQAAQAISKIKAGDPCPTCLRKVPQEVRDRIMSISKMEDFIELEGVFGRTDKDLKTVREKRMESSTKIAVAQRLVEEFDRYKALITASKAVLAELRSEEKEKQENISTAQTELQYAKTIAEVFGPKGVRSLILEGALDLLDKEVNEILGIFGGDFSIKIAASREGLKGPINDISLSVIKAGGGSYAGCSEGERKRIDLAIILGLGKLSSIVSRHEQTFGFYFFDDVFDILDDAGVIGFCEYATEMSKENLVVVMTHDPRVRTSFPSARIYRCEKTGDFSSISEIN